MATLTALYDACVLYPADLRDLLMRLALADLFRARWTDRIHDEWIRNLSANRPDLSRERLERTRAMMNNSVEDCLVTGYEGLIASLQLPDENDRHVLAAAITGRADVIVTSNLSDFPAEVLAEYGIEAQHPDAFIRRLLDLYPDIVCVIVRSQRADLKNPPKSAEQLLAGFEQIGLRETANHLRQWIHLI